MNHFFCRRCGAKLREDSVFCDKCGTKIISLPALSSASTRFIDPVPEQNRSKTNVITHQQSVEKEHFHQVPICQELNEAQQKRKVATQEEDKKKANRILVITAVAVIVMIYIIKSGSNPELRNFATETMNESYSNVYADVVSMEPEFFVYDYKYGKSNLSEVVCRCKTVEGKTIWASFFIGYYPNSGYSKFESSYKALTYSYDKPLRLIGDVDTARQVVAELEDAIGNIFVLDVREKPKQ